MQSVNSQSFLFSVSWGAVQLVRQLTDWTHLQSSIVNRRHLVELFMFRFDLFFIRFCHLHSYCYDMERHKRDVSTSRSNIFAYAVKYLNFYYMDWHRLDFVPKFVPPRGGIQLTWTSLLYHEAHIIGFSNCWMDCQEVTVLLEFHNEYINLASSSGQNLNLDKTLFYDLNCTLSSLVNSKCDNMLNSTPRRITMLWVFQLCRSFQQLE